MPVAGWYEDPRATGGLRFWDGYLWTDWYRAPAMPPPRPPTPPRRRWGWMTWWAVGLGVAAIAVAGLFALSNSPSKSTPASGSQEIVIVVTECRTPPFRSDELWASGTVTNNSTTNVYTLTIGVIAHEHQFDAGESTDGGIIVSLRPGETQQFSVTGVLDPTHPPTDLTCQPVAENVALVQTVSP